MEEYRSPDWSRIRASGSAEHIPDTLRRLASANDPQVATTEYWRLDNTVVVQGRLFEAAVPVSRCLVQLLPIASKAGRSRIVELLAQITNGEPDQSEIDFGYLNIREDCIGAIVECIGDIEMVMYDGFISEKLNCIDVLTACAEVRTEYMDRVLTDLEGVITREKKGEVADLAQRWLADLRS